MNLFSNTITALQQGLQYSSIKSEVISQNIANADTPNYKAMKVGFRTELDAAIEVASVKSDERHFDFQASKASPIKMGLDSQNYNSTGNSVDMDSEMSELAQNQIYHHALIERLNGQFNTLRNVIKGGN